MSHSGSGGGGQSPVYDQWVQDTLNELKLRAQPTQPFARPATSSPDLAKLPPPPQGRGTPTGPIGRLAGRMLFGSEADRRDADLARAPGPDDGADLTHKRAMRARIAGQVDKGTAAPQAVQSGGKSLSGTFFSAAGHNLKQQQGPDLGKPVVLFLSGSGGTAETQGTEIAEAYQQIGASVLAMNYGGYGGSTGEPSEQGLLDDGQAMIRHLLEMGYQADQIVLHGYSMGGAVAGQLQAANEGAGLSFKGLMLDRPMLSATHGVKGHMPLPQSMGRGNRMLGAVAGAVARKTVGTMSARKALAQTASTVPTVIATDSTAEAGDNQIFNEWAADLRDSLRSTRGGPKVGGAQSAGTHEDHAAMLAANRGAMANLVHQPSDLATPATVPAPPTLPPAQAKATLELEADVCSVLDSARRYHTQFAARANARADPGGPTAAARLSSLVGLLETVLARTTQLDLEGAPFTMPGEVKALLAGLRGDVKTGHAMLAALNRPRPLPPALLDPAVEACAAAVQAWTALAASSQAMPGSGAVQALQISVAKAASELREILAPVGDAAPAHAAKVLAAAEAVLSGLRATRPGPPPRPPRHPILRRRTAAAPTPGPSASG